LSEWPKSKVTVVANRDRPADLADELVTWLQAARDTALVYYVGHG
jgi:hypothetical protein